MYITINLSGLVSLCQIQENSYFQRRSERLILIHIKEYINRLHSWKKRSIAKFTATKLIMSDWCMQGTFFQSQGAKKVTITAFLSCKL